MSELLEQLRGAGTLEARGRFTLDADKAREKLRQFQLADPHRYVLLLVEAMSLAGATKLEFAIDADDVRLRCICRPFGFEQLADLYASLFITIDPELDERARAHLRGLQQLAFALNSAMALNPRFIRVESVDAEGRGALLELRPDQPDHVARIEGAEPGTRVHVRDRFRPGLLVEFFRSVGAGVAEQRLLRRHCRWSPPAIELDGERISGPYQLEGEAWFHEPIIDEGRTIGCAALHLLPIGASQPPPAFVELLCQGVWIERANLEGQLAGFAAIVDDPRLGRDVSQAQILRDAALDHVFGLLREAEARLVARLAARTLEAAGREGVEVPAWTEATLRDWLVASAGPSTPGVTPAVPTKRLATLLEHPHFANVAEVPLWPKIGGGRVSTAAVIGASQVLYSEESFEFVVRAPTFVVDLGDVDDRLAFLRLFERAVDYAPVIRAEHARERRRNAFLTRTHAAGLPDGYYLCREPLRAAGLVGEVGLRSLDPRDSWVRLVREGCLLQEVVVDALVPGLCAVIEAEFEANDDWDRARTSELLASAALELLRALERLVRGLASSALQTITYELRELLRAYVRAVCDRRMPLELFVEFGFDEREARELLRRMAPAGVALVWELEGPQPHPLACVPLYDQAEGQPLSLVELAAWRRAGQRIAWLDHEVGPLPALDRGVLLLDADDRVALRTIFGERDDAFERYHDQIARLRRREEFLATPKRPLEHLAATLVGAPVHAPPGAATASRLRGELALREFSARADSILATGAMQVRVYHHERVLQELELEAPLPGLVAWIEDDQLEVAPSWRELARASDLRPALLAALPKLIARTLERARHELAKLRRCELWFLQRALVLLLGDEALLRAFVALRAAGRPTEIAELIGLLDRCPSRDLSAAIGRVRGRGELPTRAALERELTRVQRGPNGSELELAALRIGLADLLDALLAAPLLRAMQGSRASALPCVRFDELLTHAAAGSTIAWVPEGFRIDELPAIEGRIVVLDGVEQRLVQALFGEAGCEDVSAWLAGRARFERRRRVDEVRLPSQQALVKLAIHHEQGQVRGELGLVRESPRAAGRSRVRVFHLGRHVTDVDLPSEPLALVGALEFATLELAASHEALDSAGFARVRAEVDRHRDALVDLLMASYEQLQGADRLLAAEQLRRVLVAWPPGSGGYATRAKRAPKRFAALAELAIFPGARRPWTASELAEAAQRRPIATIDARVDRAMPEGPVVVLERADLFDVLSDLFGKPRDLSAEWARADEIARIKAAAPRLPTRPAHALASIAIDREGLRGELWWAPGVEPRIALGDEDRCFGWRGAPEAFPCGGALVGPEVAITGNFTRASLGRGGERVVEQVAHELWTAMIDEFERLDAEPTPELADRHAGLREALLGQFMRLHAGGRSKPRRKAGKKQGKARGRPEQMVERLWTLRLLRLASGHHVSPALAERERPIELVSLALWSGPSAAELAARAEERKQAEERRAAELAAERERERARRRDEERDAQRRAAEQKQQREQAARAEQLRQQAARAAKPSAAKPSAAKPSEGQPSKSRRSAPPPRTREDLLLDALRGELRLVRAKREGLLANHCLESLRIESRGGGPLFTRGREGTVVLDRDHALVEATIAARLDDPAMLTILASATYSYLNLVHPEITDEDEAAFLRLHAAHAASVAG